MGIQVNFQSFGITYCILGNKHPWTYITVCVCVCVCVCGMRKQGGPRSGGAGSKDTCILNYGEWLTPFFKCGLAAHLWNHLPDGRKLIRYTTTYALCFSSSNNAVRYRGKSFLYFVQESQAQQGAGNPNVTRQLPISLLGTLTLGKVATLWIKGRDARSLELCVLHDK